MATLPKIFQGGDCRSWVRSIFFLKILGRYEGYIARRAVRDVAEATGHHLPIVGAAFRVPGHVENENSWLLRVPLTTDYFPRAALAMATPL